MGLLNDELIPIDLGSHLTDSRRRMTIDQDDLRQHMTVLGKPGFGKSRLLQHLIRQLLLNRGGVGVLDPAGDLVDDIALWLAENIDDIEPFIAQNITFFEVGKDSSFALDPLWYWDGTPGDAGHHDWLVTRSQEIAFALLRTCGQQDFHDTRRLARFLTVAIYACGVPLDRHGRHVPLPEARTLINPLQPEAQARLSRLVYPLLPSEYQSDLDLVGRGDKESRELTASTLNLLRTFFDGSVSAIFACEAEPFDFRRLLQRRGGLLVNLRKGGRLSEHQADAIGFFIQSEIYNAALYNAEHLTGDDREPFTLVIDEAAHFVDERLGDHLRESRKFGLSYILAAQDTSALRTDRIDLSGIVLNLPNTQVTFQQQDERELARLAPIFTYAGLKTKPLLHEEQRLHGHALVPVVEETERRELQEAWRNQHKIVDSKIIVDRQQHERATSDALVSGKRHEDLTSEHDRKISLERQLENQLQLNEVANKTATQEVERRDAITRQRTALKNSDEFAAAELSRKEARKDNIAAQENINLSSVTKETGNEHADLRVQTDAHIQRHQETDEERTAKAHVVSSGHDHIRKEHQQYLQSRGPDGALHTHQTIDTHLETADTFATLNTETEEKARRTSHISEHAATNSVEFRDTSIERKRERTERQAKQSAVKQDIASDVKQHDEQRRHTQGTEHAEEDEHRNTEQSEKSQANIHTTRTVKSEQDEHIRLTEHGQVAEQRDARFDEQTQTTRDQKTQASGSEVKNEATDEKQEATAEIRSLISAERFVTLPVNVLVHQPTGQWEQSEDQQTGKWKGRIRKLKKRQCAVASGHHKARRILVPEVKDAFDEYPDQLRLKLLQGFKKYLIDRSPSCFVPRLGRDADQQRLQSLLLNFEQLETLAIAGPPIRAALSQALPAAALPAPNDCPFDI